ncbi:Crp/Fnr family transcriptional regulator [Pedobacter sp. KBS0701]|uniref:Crp/Fnr family transcriptional regulator n=1 Tax=Pedobacter sp. KBS0701 TaxID=2578106 RepID=UPI00110ED331|nr:Crp/Fnr family transcriptional regulator [Pedobacter sp. KBS0701]QDW23961.1 Crp/Fnr family transcriptional regulator [Pedobacter sp. KBS0701]
MENESYFKKIECYLKPSYGLKCYLNYSLHERTFNKKQAVKVSELFSSSLIFISKGTLRLYAVKEEEETTILFWQKDRLLTSLLTLGEYTGKEIYAEFLEDSAIIAYREIHTGNLYNIFPQYRELINKLYQEQISDLILHAESLAHLTANARFNNLMKLKPELFNLCELKVIANYLGIHPKVLSRLRAKAVKR